MKFYERLKFTNGFDLNPIFFVRRDRVSQVPCARAARDVSLARGARAAAAALAQVIAAPLGARRVDVKVAAAAGQRHHPAHVHLPRLRHPRCPALLRPPGDASARDKTRGARTEWRS